MKNSMLRFLRNMATRTAARPDPAQGQVQAIERLGVFDRAAYLAGYPEVARSGIDPVRHYVLHGARAGCNPCAEPICECAYGKQFVESYGR